MFIRRLSLRPEDDTIARSILTLHGYLNSIMTSILKSVEECPVFMRIVFRNLARRVYQHFGEDSGNEVIFDIPGLENQTFLKGAFVPSRDGSHLSSKLGSIRNSGKSSLIHSH